MKFLNIEETIVVDEEKREVLFLVDASRNFKIPCNQQWDLFLLLLSEEGQECSTSGLETKLNVFSSSGKSADSPIKTLANRLRKELNEKGIPCNGGKEEDANKIIIKNRRNDGIRENTGAYTLILPKVEKKNEKILADLYWTRYENLSVQKEGEHKNDELIAKIGDVYQIPLMQEHDHDCEWSIENTDVYNQNILIEAPNGYGKTTFMRSILLAATYGYRSDLSSSERQKYGKIRQFHRIDDSYLCIYIECKNIDFDRLREEDEKGWIYENLAGMESIRIDKYIDKGNFESLIKTYNMSKKLILLVDGFDEIKAEYRSILIKKMNDFQRKKDFGCYSRVIMTTRPLFWEIDFNGYKKYTISNRNIIEDKDVFLKYVRGYSRNNKSLDAEQLYTYVINNHYLKNIVCTPAIIVWIVREYHVGAFYESMERIIEQMMLRYKSRELTVHKEQYKRVYEEIAYKYLILTENDEGLLYLDTEVLSLVRGCIDKIELEGNRKFNKIFSDENKDDEELGELFFTNVALMEYLDGRIKFTTTVFAYHLAARLILRTFNGENYKVTVYKRLSEIPYQYRYYVMVIASSLALHLTDTRFFEGFGVNASDIRFDLADDFFEYIQDRWNDSKCDKDEKMHIQKAIAHLLLKYYGDNVFTNRNMCNSTYNSWMENVMVTELEGCSDVVSEYRNEKRWMNIYGKH